MWHATTLVLPDSAGQEQYIAEVDVSGSTNLAPLSGDIDVHVSELILPALGGPFASGLTASVAMVSFPHTDSMDYHSSYVTMATIELGNSHSLALQVQYPQQIPLLSISHSIPVVNGSKPLQCYGRQRVAVYREKLTIQVAYSENTRVLRMLLFVGNMLSNKCTFRADGMWNWNFEPYSINIPSLASTHQVGYVSAIHYSPTILTFLEVIKTLQMSFLENALLSGTMLCFLLS